MNWKGQGRKLSWTVSSTIPAVRMVNVPEEIRKGHFQNTALLLRETQSSTHIYIDTHTHTHTLQCIKDGM